MKNVFKNVFILVMVLLAVLLSAGAFQENGRPEDQEAFFSADSDTENINFIAQEETDISQIFNKPKRTYLLQKGNEIKKINGEYIINILEDSNPKLNDFIYLIKKKSSISLSEEGGIIRASITANLPKDVTGEYNIT